MTFRRLCSGLCVLWVISAGASSPPTKVVTDEGQTTTTQHQSASKPVNVPPDAVTQAAPVNQVVTHQPQSNVLNQQSSPQQRNDDNDKFHILGLHIKLDSLVAILALIVSAIALWMSRSGSREANRIAREALELARRSRSMETSSSVRWTGIHLVHNAIEEGENKFEASLQNFGKSPAIIKSVGLVAVLPKNGGSPAKVIRQVATTIAPGQSESVQISFLFNSAESDAIHEGDMPLNLIANASVVDDESEYLINSIFEFESNTLYGFALRSSSTSQ